MALTKVSTGMLSADVASIDLNIDANTMYIDVSNNRVGINNAAPSTALDVTGSVTADAVALNTTLKTWDASTDAIQLQSGSLWNYSTSQLNLGQNEYYNGGYKYLTTGAASTYNQASGGHFFKTAVSGSADAAITWVDVLSIDASGNVGIGSTAGLSGPSAATTLRIGNQINLYEYDDSSNPVQLNLNQNIDSNENYIATDQAARYQMRDGVHSWSSVASGTAGTSTNIGANEKMRIDASGNLLVGKTDTSIATQGVFFGPNYSHITSTNDTPLALSRKGNDGALVSLRKDGLPVGSIGTLDDNSIYIGNGEVNLRMIGVTNDIRPVTSTGTNRDAAVDLGDANARFKDLYLSGGVVFGATGGAVSSKTLEDYETGTFTPTLFGSGSSATTLLTALGRYVKVGKSVTCWIEISCNGSTTLPTGNYISLAGLPFNPVSSRAFTAVVSVTGLTGLAAGTYFVGITNSGTSVNLNKYNQDGIIGTVGLTAASLTSTFAASTSITYEVA